MISGWKITHEFLPTEQGFLSRAMPFFLFRVKWSHGCFTDVCDGTFGCMVCCVTLPLFGVVHGSKSWEKTRSNLNH